MAEHIAQLRNLRMAPRKVRLVADLVRGMAVNEAEARLSLDRHRAAEPLLKLLRSAMDGASKKSMDLEALYVKTIRVDQGSMMKRYMPRAQGRGVQIQKKSSHIIIGLGENPLQPGARFTMPEKKKKKPSDEHKHEEKKPAKPKKKAADVSDAPKKKEGGVVKKVFSRKSGEA